MARDHGPMASSPDAQHGGQCYPSRITVQPHSEKGQVASCCLTPNQALPYLTFRLLHEPCQGILAAAHCLTKEIGGTDGPSVDPLCCRMSSGRQTDLRKKGLGTMLEVLPELQ